MPAEATEPPPPHSATGRSTLRELTRDRSFVLYLVGQTTSGAGSALSSVALVFAVLSISRSPGSVGIVLLASRLPAIGLALFGGFIADRWPRNRVAAGADAARAALQFVSGILLIDGRITMLELALLQLFSGGAGALFRPAANALLAGVAPHGEVRRASSLLGITTALAQTGGLALSGALVALAGPGTSLLVDGATFAVSTMSLALIPRLTIAPTEAKPSSPALRDGWQAVTSHRWLSIYAVQETVVNVTVLCPLFVLGPVIAKAQLGGPAAWSTIALGYVIGTLAAANITYHWAPQRPILAAVTVTATLAPMLALLGLGAPLWVIVPAAVLAGAETTITNTLVGATFQANLPDQILGRASAITSIGSTVLVPVGMGLAGLVADAAGTCTVMICATAVVLITTAICVSLPDTRIHLTMEISERR